MPGKKGSKALQERLSKIGKLSSDNAESAKKLSELQLIYDQNVSKITNKQRNKRKIVHSSFFNC